MMGYSTLKKSICSLLMGILMASLLVVGMVTTASAASNAQWVCSGSGVGRTCTYTWWVGNTSYTKTCVNNYDSEGRQYYWECSTSQS